MQLKKIIKLMLLVTFVLIVLGILFANIDYSRIKNNEKPVLSIYMGKDKYTEADMYYGLGYTIIKCPDYYEDGVKHEDSYHLFLFSKSHACISE